MTLSASCFPPSPAQAYSPLPFLLGFLSSECTVPGQRREVVPVVYWESFKSPIRALGKDIVGRVLCHTSLLYTLEPAKSHGHSLYPERPALAHHAPIPVPSTERPGFSEQNQSWEALG